MKHVYPSKYPPSHPDPFVRVSWALLDKLKPDALNSELRFLIAGMIAGALGAAYDAGREKRTAADFAKKYER